jgi:hypothetical protein
MPRDATESHGFEYPSELGGIRGRVLDELESVGREGVCRVAQGFGRMHKSGPWVGGLVGSACAPISIEKSVLFRTSLSNI